MAILKKASNEEIKETYFQFLSEMVENKTYDEQYLIFLRWLHSHIFTYFVPNDDNRAGDGIYLREEFQNHTNFANLSALNGPCSMLEMLIGLSIRMDFQTSTSRAVLTEKWFWFFIRNLNLKVFYSRDRELEKKKQINEIILKKLLERTYLPTGKGGLFPLNKAIRDQRKVEIWYQMADYIIENYD